MKNDYKEKAREAYKKQLITAFPVFIGIALIIASFYSNFFILFFLIGLSFLIPGSILNQIYANEYRKYKKLSKNQRNYANQKTKQ